MYMVKKTRKNFSPSAEQDLLNLAASLEQPFNGIPSVTLVSR
jgi:hypothetical protein